MLGLVEKSSPSSSSTLATSASLPGLKSQGQGPDAETKDSGSGSDSRDSRQSGKGDPGSAGAGGGVMGAIRRQSLSRPQSARPPPPELTLEDVVRSKSFYLAFEAYLKTMHCVENLYCLRILRRFEKCLMAGVNKQKGRVQ